MKKSAAPIQCNKEDEMVDVNSKIDEMYRPFLIHSTTYLLLTDQILSLLPFQRNVVLTMNEYDLSDINPMHPKTDDSPTHIIIFCIRFVTCDTFQPIGGLLTYKHEDQSVLLAECLKAFINDIWKLGLYVVATVSPAVETFRGILSHVVDIKDFDTYSDVITYSVAPFKEIVHIYDIHFLIKKLQNLFKERDIRFKEGTREYLACWDDLATVISSSKELKILSSYLLQNNVSQSNDDSLRVHIFSQQIFERYLEFEACGNLSKNAGGCAVLLDNVRSFLQFTELDLVDLAEMCKGHNVWELFTAILRTMKFQKPNKRTIAMSSARRKINFDVDYLDIEGLVYNMEGNLLIKEQEDFERNRLENLGIDPAIINNKKKGKKKKGLNEASSANKAQTDVDQSIGRLGNKFKLKKQPKPYEKPNNGKVSNIEKLDNTTIDTSIKKEKTDHINGSCQNSKSYEKSKEIFLESKPYYKTDNFYNNVNSDSNKSRPNKFDNNIDTNCDKNNYSEVNLDVNKKQNSTTSKDNCDSKIRKKQIKKNIEGANFDVLNNAQMFFKNFSLNNPNTSNNQLQTKTNNSKESQNFTETDKKKYFRDDTQGTSGTSSDINVNVSKDKTPNDNQKSLDTCLNDFCSPSDEETENSINKSCDKIPNIIQLLSNVADKEKPPDEFERNSLVDEMLSTVTGMKKLMENLLKRRVKMAKPDAFIVEHIDFLVSMIKRDKNNITSAQYYGHSYVLLNSELAFDTLQNNKGLYLVTK